MADIAGMAPTHRNRPESCLRIADQTQRSEQSHLRLVVADDCLGDALLKKHKLNDPALDELALIVRGAVTSRTDLAPQCPGLLAISLGLSHVFEDDHEQLRYGLVLYDALYAWCKHVRGETHNWNPQRKA